MHRSDFWNHYTHNRGALHAHRVHVHPGYGYGSVGGTVFPYLNFYKLF